MKLVDKQTHLSLCAANTGSPGDTVVVLRTLFAAFVGAFVAPLRRVGIIAAVLKEHEKRTF